MWLTTADSITAVNSGFPAGACADLPLHNCSSSQDSVSAAERYFAAAGSAADDRSGGMRPDFMP